MFLISEVPLYSRCGARLPSSSAAQAARMAARSRVAQPHLPRLLRESPPQNLCAAETCSLSSEQVSSLDSAAERPLLTFLNVNPFNPLASDYTQIRCQFHTTPLPWEGLAFGSAAKRGGSNLKGFNLKAKSGFRTGLFISNFLGSGAPFQSICSQIDGCVPPN